MADREKVIRGLECCLNTGNFEECTENCPYFTKELGVGVCSENMERDALSLLKAQEPVEPYVTGNGTGFESATSWWYACGNCNKPIDMKDKFCRHCGRAVKWDE